jgi:dihydroxyacetone kinase
LADGVTIGNVFASPSAESMLEVDRAIHASAGVLHLYGNYGGDIMNFGMAADMAAMEDIEVAEVLVSDDVASAPKGEEAHRRGVAGLVYAYKIAGAAAEKLLPLAEVARLAQKAVDNTRTMGVALSSCIVPEVGKATFSIGEDEMEIGMGIHGEPGIKRTALKEIDEVIAEILEKIVEDLPYQAGDEVSVLVNSLGATPKEELYIAYRKVHGVLNNKGIKIHRPYIGEFATSLEMAGLSVTLLKLDAELKELLDAPAYSPFFQQSR